MNYILKRSNRKTLAIQITEELELLVRAPLRLPKRDIDRFIEKHTEWIRVNMEKQRAHAQADLTDTEITELRWQAQMLLPKRVKYYSDIMGLTPAALKVTSAKTRFGSCSSRNSLCFSYRLMCYPAAAIDYVVVHELAHIVHKNHGKAFHDLVASILPDFKERRALLRNRG